MRYLSITVITGATIEAAANPETASDANLSPKFFVFHFLCSNAASGTFEVRVKDFGDSSRLIGEAGHSVVGD